MTRVAFASSSKAPPQVISPPFPTRTDEALSAASQVTLETTPRTSSAPTFAVDSAIVTFVPFGIVTTSPAAGTPSGSQLDSSSQRAPDAPAQIFVSLPQTATSDSADVTLTVYVPAVPAAVGVPAGKTAKVSFAGFTGGMSADKGAKSVSVTAVADDAPGFTAPEYAVAGYRNVKFSAKFGLTGIDGATGLSFKYVSGSLPKGLTARWGGEASLLVEGRAFVLTQGPQRGSVTLSGDEIVVPGAPERAALRVATFLKALARDRLSQASDRYAAQIGRKYKSLTLRDTRSRWGSCTADGSLMYSWRLIMAPPAVLDYVAAHEVSHLAEMNHSDRFWAVVEGLMPDYAPRRKWLKEHGGRLHAYRFED